MVLNVYTPAANDGRRRPVFFYVHGGGFGDGSGCAPGVEGTYLAARGDIVVVTINHRLNVLGHLYLGDAGPYADAGNSGILDIITALSWVRENIAVFGGDPDNVTICGQSGGGSKVAVLMTTPLAKGLFRRAIIQSGSSLLRMATREEALRGSNALLAELDISRNRLDDLQRVPLETLMAAMRKAESAVGNHFRPVVDGRTLPAHPFSPGAFGESADVPLLIGSCEDELRFHMGAGLGNFSLTDADMRARVRNFIGIDDAKTEQLIAEWRRNHPSASPSDIMFSIFSEYQYRRNNLAAAESKTALEKAQVFMYLFTWKTKMMEGHLRTPHTMCLAFCFGTVDAAAGMLGTGADVQALKERVMDAWIAFARTGNPSHAGLPAWPPFSLAGRPTMDFDNQCLVVNDPKSADRLALKDYPEYVPAECRGPRENQ
ncbi:MAG: carboxylesterase family protein [Gammaproteobacteria bacterium]|nr:carboxylesterase family protein [Gammaproteobacteria bacterium]